MVKQTEEQIRSFLTEHQQWVLVEGKLQRRFRFRNFIEAFSFMSAVALIAEKINHHPEWSNVYNTVTVNLTTHDADGITELDFRLATKMDEFAARCS